MTNQMREPDAQKTEHRSPIHMKIFMWSLIIPVSVLLWYLFCSYTVQMSIDKQNLFDGFAPALDTVIMLGRVADEWILRHLLVLSLLLGVFLAVLFTGSGLKRKRHRLILLGLALIIGAFAETYVHLTMDYMKPAIEQKTLLLVSALTLLLSAVPCFFAVTSKVAHAADWGTRKSGLILLLILCLGFVLRIYHLDKKPAGMGGHELDQANTGIMMLEGKVLLHDPGLLPTIKAFYNRTINFRAGFSDMSTAAFFYLFGAHLATMQVLAVTLGMLVIPLTYLLLKNCFGSQSAGFIGAWLTAVCPLLINFSRYPSERAHSMTPVHALAGAYFFIRGMQTARFSHFLAAGLIAGVAGSLYEPSYFFIHILIATFGLYVILHLRKLQLKIILGSLGTILIGLVLFYPILRTVIKINPFQPGFLKQRSYFIAPDISLQTKLVMSYITTFIYADGCSWFFRAGPILNAAILPLLMLGAALALKRIKNPAYSFLISWLIIGSLPPILSDVVARRFLLVIPAFYVCISLLIDYTVKSLREKRDFFALLTAPLVGSFLVIITLLNAHMYFNKTTVQQSDAPCNKTIGEFINRSIPDYFPYFLPEHQIMKLFVNFITYEKSKQFNPMPLEFVDCTNWLEQALKPQSGPKGSYFITDDQRIQESFVRILSSLYPGSSVLKDPCFTCVSIPPNAQPIKDTETRSLLQKSFPVVVSKAAPITSGFSHGMIGGKYGEPRYLASDPRGGLVLVRRMPSQVQLFDLDGNEKALFQFPEFDDWYPDAISCSSDYIFICYSNLSIIVLDRSGTIKYRWHTLNEPLGIAANDTFVYCIGRYDKSIKIFAADGTKETSPEVLGIPQNELLYPQTITIAPNGTVCIGDILQRVHYYDPVTQSVKMKTPFTIFTSEGSKVCLQCPDEKLLLINDPLAQQIIMQYDHAPVVQKDGNHNILPQPFPRMTNFVVIGTNLYVCQTSRSIEEPAIVKIDLQPMLEEIYQQVSKTETGSDNYQQ